MNDELTQLSFLSEFLNEGIYFIDENQTANPIIKTPTIQKVVLEKSIEEPEENYVTSRIDHYGSNKKSVSILVNYEQEKWITIKDKMVLEKILAAIQLNFEDVALINISQQKVTDIAEIISKLSPKLIIAFGINPDFMLNLEQDKISEKHGVTVIYARDSITEIAMSKEKKTVLWKNLRQAFGL